MPNGYHIVFKRPEWHQKITQWQYLGVTYVHFFPPFFTYQDVQVYDSSRNSSILNGSIVIVEKCPISVEIEEEICSWATKLLVNLDHLVSCDECRIDFIHDHTIRLDNKLGASVGVSRRRIWVVCWTHTEGRDESWLFTGATNIYRFKKENHCKEHKIQL